MEYTLEERKKRIWEMIEEDPECQAIVKHMELDRFVHEMLTDRLPVEEGRELWAYPTAIYLYHGRVLELLCRELRLPGETDKTM